MLAGADGGGDELGDDLLEVGAGPGLVTDLLVGRVERVTAVEIDPVLADALRARLPQVDVLTGDATALPLPDARFSAVACFTMLHHIADPADQDPRARRDGAGPAPGRVAAGHRRRGHPAAARAAGFAEVLVDSDGDRFRFRARR